MTRRRKPDKIGNKPIKFEDYRILKVESTNLDKKLKPKNLVTLKCDFDYPAEQINLVFLSTFVTFRPISIAVYFRKQSVTSSKFPEIEQFTAKNKTFQNVVSFKNVCIDFFGFSANRIFSIEITFDTKEFPGKVIKETFSLTLPVINQSEYFFNPPGTRYPDAVTRKICFQGFKMNETNSETEIKRCIILEEFKLVPVVDRYKVYGYVDMLQLFLDIENSFELDLVAKMSLNNAEVKKCSETNFKIDTPGQISSTASTVCLTPMEFRNISVDSEELKKLQICAPIVSYNPKSVVVEIKRNQFKKFDEKARYHVEFRPNFFSSAMAQRAMTRIVKNGFENFFLDFKSLPKSSRAKMNFVQFDEISWLNVAVGGNPAQSSAIKHILNRTNFPSPYIVFGPPGTGKTSTLVEAVAQIVKLIPKAKVLVTVNSNSACDEIGDRLLKFCGANKVFRFYSPSFSKKMNRVHPKLKSCSNLKYGYHIQPSYQELLSYNVIICTLVNSGRLNRLGPNHFDFIFIDECASSAEPYVDIPMSLAMKEDEKFTASVVLLGDPKQLGQIMRTHHSERFGFSVSLMERVMCMSGYDFPYDPRRIVQLTDNFRSHVNILDYSNKKFYNSILVAKQQKIIANFAVGWKMLPNPDIPVIFHASWTKSEVDGTSQFNNGDIAIVRKYVKCLLKEGICGRKVSPKDIGIISPYAAQREKLMEIYTNGIEIGTVEYFQGREKLIIIVSSVRSKTPTIGFLKNEKRLNVALTRAKALLIVVGNPETLGKNKFWRDFIVLCCKNKTTVGNVPGWILKKDGSLPESDEDEDDVVRLEEMMNEMNIED